MNAPKTMFLLAVVAVALSASSLAVSLRRPAVTVNPAAALPAKLAAFDPPSAARVAAAAPAASTLPDVAEAAVQSVVNISTTKVTLQRVPRDEQFFRRLWGLGSGDREEQTAHSLGSGVIVSADGVVLTNNHVVEGGDVISVRLSDGRELEASVVGRDPRSDLAVLRLKGNLTGLRPLPLADSDKVRLGEMVLAIGSPFGLAQSVSLGIVSAKGRANVNIADFEDFIQTDAAINPGNSGGALVNLKGELVGINTAIASSTGGSQGIGFAIPSNMLRPIMRSILQNGRMVRGWLGVAIQTAKSDEGGPAGVLINEVVADSVAAKAGMQKGDIVTQVGKTMVSDAQHFRNAISQSGAGTTVHLAVRRGGKDIDLAVTLAEAPEPKRFNAP